MDDEIRHPLAYTRIERGWSQEELARRIRRAAARRGLRSGTRGSRVSKWETGRAIPDEDESQPLIAEVFGIDYAAVAHLGWPNWLPSQDKPLPLGPHNAAPSLREALMTSLDRRSFLAYTSGALTALAHQWAITEPGRFPQITPRGDVDTEMVDWLESAGAELIRLATERRQRTAALLGEHLRTVTEIISEGRCTRPVEQRLHTLAASFCQAIAWQKFDERRHAAAGRFWHAACPRTRGHPGERTFDFLAGGHVISLRGMTFHPSTGSVQWLDALARGCLGEPETAALGQDDVSCPEFRRVRRSCFRRTAGWLPVVATRRVRTR
ncbi:helix-turn-helix transcriptional regulator, partial [Streptomyces sp. NPDC048324]|uniref:helix-turn-helix transcriptional regulator n=1 Tax=Streptomyces sp. NPDC048324 TaxID=3157205 RepID=UPI00343CD1BB